MLNVNALQRTLSAMTLPEIQKYASLHKNDPYVVSMAMSVANTKKEAQTAMQGMAGQRPMPKVIDQEIANMAAVDPMGNATGLPENQGIGTLPAPNLSTLSRAGGGIVAFDDGGAVEHYDRGGLTQNQWRSYALTRAQEMGLDPRFVDSIFQAESKYNPNAKSGTGPVGIGQISEYIGKSVHGQRAGIDPSTVGKGESVDQRFDPKKNIDTSLNFLADLNKKYGGDKQKVAIGYNQGEPYLDQHLKENKGQVNVAALKKEPKSYLQKTVESMIPSATAAETGVAALAPKAAQTTQAAPTKGDIPAPLSEARVKEVQAQPEAGPRREAGMLGSIKDYYASPTTWEGVKRNVGETLNALGGWSSPVSMAGKGIDVASGALKPTAKAIEEAAALKRVAETPRIVGPAAKGIETLAPEAAATREAAETARRMRMLEQDQQIARGAEQSVKAADETAAAARAMEEGIAAVPRELSTASTQLSTAGRGKGVADLLAGAGGAEAAAAAAAAPSADTSTTLPADVPGSIKDITKSVASGQGGNNYLNEMMTMLGLGMMAGKSPYATQNIGEAGIGALKFGKELKAADAEERYKNAIAAHYGVPSEVQLANWLGESPENAAAYQRVQELKREPVTKEAMFKQFMASPGAMALKPDEVAPAFQKYVQSYESMFGPIGELPAGSVRKIR